MAFPTFYRTAKFVPTGSTESEIARPASAWLVARPVRGRIGRPAPNAAEEEDLCAQLRTVDVTTVADR